MTGMTVFAAKYSKSPISHTYLTMAFLSILGEIGDFEYFAAKTVIPVIPVKLFCATRVQGLRLES